MQQSGVSIFLQISFKNEGEYLRWLQSKLNVYAAHVQDYLRPLHTAFPDQRTGIFDNTTDLSTSKGNNFEEAWEAILAMGFEVEEQEVSKRTSKVIDGETWWQFWFKSDLPEGCTIEELLAHLRQSDSEKKEFFQISYFLQNNTFQIESYLSGEAVFDYLEPLAMLCIEAFEISRDTVARMSAIPGHHCEMMYELVFLDTKDKHFNLAISPPEDLPEDFYAEFWGDDSEAASTFEKYLQWCGTDAKKIWELETAGQYGFVDADGNWIIKPRFPEAANFIDGLALVQDPRNYRYGYIEAGGNYAIAPRFQFGFGFVEGIAKVKELQKYGFIDRQGNYTIRPQFAEADRFYEQRAVITEEKLQKKKKGFINLQGEVVIPPVFAEAFYFSSGRALVMDNAAFHDNGETHCAFIDTEGNFMCEYMYQQAWYFYEEVAPVKINGLWGMLNKDMTYLVQPQFQSVWYMSKGFALIQQNGKWGFINHKGEVVLAPDAYDAIYHDPHESNRNMVFAVKKGRYFGFVNHLGEKLGEAIYEECILPREDMAVVKKDGLWGYMNTKGEVVIAPRFKEARLFGNGRALVKDKTGNHWGIIDKEGNWIKEPKYDLQDAGYFAGNGITYIKQHKGYGLMNTEGEIVLDTLYERIDSYGEALILVKCWG